MPNNNSIDLSQGAVRIGAPPDHSVLTKEDEIIPFMEQLNADIHNKRLATLLAKTPFVFGKDGVKITETDDEIQYMTMTPSFAENLPEGISAVDEHGRQKVCRVIKPIYGMKQAGHLWHRTLNEYLVDKANMTRCSADPCVYVRREDDGRAIVIGTYVDDLTIASNDPAYRDQFVSALGKTFAITDEGPLADIVNVQIQPNTDKSVTIHQRAYIEKLAAAYLGDLTTRTQYKNPAHGDLPGLVEQAVESSATAPADLVHSYQSLVGALLYCAVSTRPDISYAVGMLCRAMTKPTQELLAAAQRVLIYLSVTKDLGITFEANDSDAMEVSGFSDSDWAVKHSTSGYLFRLAKGAVSWKSAKQPSVALSSTEAEITAASYAGAEAIYLRNLLEEIGFKQPEPTTLHVDNQGAVFISKYAGHSHSKMKHVARRHFFVRELVQDGKLRVSFVRTDDNVADLFTKPLVTRKFQELRDLAMNIKQRTPVVGT